MILFLSSFLLLDNISSSDMTFYNATKSLAKMIDSHGDWIPVPSLIDQNNFRPFCVLQKKRKTSWWQSCPFLKTDYQLHHLLLSGNDTSSLGNLQESISFIYFYLWNYLSVTFCENGITDTEITSAVSIHVFFFRKINNEHPFIKQSKKLQRNLYLITASAEAVETATFGESNKVESSIFHKAYIKLSLEGARDRKKIITIPKGCILAFKAKKLFIGEETVGKGVFLSEASRKITENTDFDTFVSEVEKEYVPFSLMSSNLRGKFLTSFVVLMKKSDLLEKLELQVKKFLLLILWFIYFYCKFYFIYLLFPKVGGILDKYFWNEKQNFTVEIQQLPEEEWDITGALIEEISGISIQRSGCTVTGSIPPDSSSNLSALYVALFAIDLLSKKSF
uniref:Gasdermin pore forming domain-containing protein n=1 Tax=Pseudonaja textilis TaxID=8673 RepID=A0A670YLW1_PSETE